MKKEQSRVAEAFQNSMVGLASRIIMIILQFYARTVFLHYLGIELIGISSTFTSLLSTLSLAELGFESAVVYTLYKPLANHDEQQINEIITVLKVIYQSIGLMFIAAGVMCLPVLPWILKGTEVTWYIRIIFLIQVSNSAATYLLAYKRSLLYADKKAYISTIIDTVMNLIVEILKIILVITTKEYLIYISLTTIQTILSNTVIHIICGKFYPFLHKTKFNKVIFRDIWGKVKNLFVGKIAYYVYASTDNLVISSLISAVAVGYTSNYLTIVSSLKGLATSVVTPITPIIGNMLAADQDEKHKEEILGVCTFARFVIAACVIPPLLVLIQDFITVWIGKEFLLPYVIILLYSADLYIHLVHSALCDYINGSGLFREERNVEIAGAACNLIVSVVLAYTLGKISVPMGVTGVLIGTIVSQTVFWVYRSIIAFRHCFPGLPKAFASYWIENLKYILFTATVTFLLSALYSTIHITFFPIKFVVSGLLCESVVVIGIILMFGKSQEFLYVRNIVVSKLPGKLREKLNCKKQ